MQFAALMGRALPDVPHQIRMFRFLILVQAGVALLADLDLTRQSWDTAGVAITPTELIEQVVDTLTGVLAGQPTNTFSRSDGRHQ